jgi:CO/xanthine dehydrogenase Mo-binding subunit
MKLVHYQNPDTFKVPDSGPTVASRTTMVVGALIAKAAMNLKPRMNEEGSFVITEHFKQPDYIKWNQDTLEGNAYMAYSWSALLARVEVDPHTYEVNCTDIWGAYDVGIPIDEKLLIGQIQGGIVQGLGYALMENMTSKNGLIEQTAFASYPIPTTMDIPRIHSDWIINRYEDGPFGAKAVGELTLVGVAPAVASAVEDAMKITTNQIPVTPEVIERNKR